MCTELYYIWVNNGISDALRINDTVILALTPLMEFKNLQEKLILEKDHWIILFYVSSGKSYNWRDIYAEG